MKYIIRLMLVTSCLLLVSTFLFGNDPAKEFSITKNPNGVWSYGFTPTLGGPFALADGRIANAVCRSMTDCRYEQGADGWYSTIQAAVCNNGIGGNITRADDRHPTIDTYAWPDTLQQHPGCNDEKAIVRWTVPQSGNYNLKGSFQGMNINASTVDVHLRWNSAASLLDGNINGFAHLVYFDLQQQVFAGDTIDFAVGYGDGMYYGDSTALQLTIYLVPNINIKPGDPDNKIHIGTAGMVPVAILSDALFDAPTMVVRSSLTFGRIGDELSLVYKPDRFDTRLQVPVCSTSDVTGDGLKDLVCKFDKQQAGFQLTDTYAVLRGKTATGITIKGTDAVHIVE
jgi:hypothetical protein